MLGMLLILASLSPAPLPRERPEKPPAEEQSPVEIAAETKFILDGNAVTWEAFRDSQSEIVELQVRREGKRVIAVKVVARTVPVNGRGK